MYGSVLHTVEHLFVWSETSVLMGTTVKVFFCRVNGFFGTEYFILRVWLLLLCVGNVYLFEASTIIIFTVAQLNVLILYLHVMSIFC